ncbi:uncharacterized protein SRS1_13196 [Sporisorium reilianum f. sp. reilianum]|uniref:Uncharacterized protein n=1 Tax=Sporisorium reilianum f. sp. reilianum TaxID=72559 RepID=A0A2N8UC70_9BASI|nr:uncharacterized protein SRS1_13196 [Sporisorium reilianum f. sp. reilianum]
MSHSETSHSPSLVLVAPMPRRPIALVARRHHHHHHHSSSHSRSRSSRTVSSQTDAANPTERAASPSRSNVAASGAAAAASAQPIASVRMVAHPYSRAKTPSNVAAASPGVNGWPLGLGISPVSPPPRSRTGSRDGLGSRPLSRLSSRDSAPLASAMAPSNLETIPDASAAGAPLDEKLADESDQADEPMSALVSPPIGSGAAVMDLERTPTKSKGRGPQLADIDVDQEPRSTPTIGAASPHPQDGVNGLTLSPTSPMEQRITAAASASAQLPLSLSSPPSLPAAVANSVGESAKSQTSPRRVDAMVAASIAPSPCLSESLLRSPSASPSPCPSPAFSTLLDLHPVSKHADEPRKMGLPPMPTSPIPRKMTRNPFERYLGVDAVRQHGGCTLHARLAMAMGRGVKQTRSVLESMETQLEDADHEMAERALSPELVGRSVMASGMEVEE